MTPTHETLLAEQHRTLETPRRRYSATAKALFVGMDVLYGRRRSLPKFVVLELVARVPYQAWEHAAYMAITRHAGETRVARRIHDRVCRARMQQAREAGRRRELDQHLALGAVVAHPGAGHEQGPPQVADGVGVGERPHRLRSRLT